MSGYSGTPLPKKLGIKEFAHVLVVHGPKGFRSLLTPLPNGVAFARGTGKKQLDVIVYFSKHTAILRQSFPRLRQILKPNGGLWIAWPKKASGVSTDVTENIVREVGISAGMVDNKVCAIDDTWSGLRFVFRLVDR